MKLYYLFFLSAILCACNTQKSIENQDLSLIKASQQIWYGGQPGVQGTHYSLELEKLTKEDLKFDSLRILNEWHPITVAQKEPLILKSNVINRSEKINKLDSLSGNDHSVDLDILIIKPGDDEFAGKNVLSYYKNGKKFYLIIDDFEQMSSKSYP